MPGVVLAVFGDMGISLNGANVSAWADQSAAANSLAQATGAKQPPFLTGQNIRPMLRFSLASSQALTKAGVNLFGAGAYTVLGLWANRAPAATAAHFANGSDAANSGLFIGALGGNRTVIHQGIVAHTDAAVPAGTVEVWCARRVAASLPTLQINGVDAALTAGSAVLTDPGLVTLSIGAYGSTNVNPADLDVYEVYAFNRDLSDLERARITAFSRNRAALV